MGALDSREFPGFASGAALRWQADPAFILLALLIKLALLLTARARSTLRHNFLNIVIFLAYFHHCGASSSISSIV